MKPTLRNFLCPCIRVVAVSCLAWASVLCGTVVTAQQFAPDLEPANARPPMGHRFPADAPLRLARAVEDRVHGFGGALSESELSAIAAGDLDQPDLRRSLWQSIEGALGAAQPTGSAPGPSAPAAPGTLIGALDSAIGAYMAELGRIALEIDQQGDRDAVTRLAPLHPGEQGSGSIDLGTLGAFHQLQVNFRGEIAHPDGRAPAVVAHFYLLPGGASRPIPGRLLIPTAGAQPSFRAEIATIAGEHETRDYGWRPRLARLGSILELNIDGQWARVEDELDAMPRRRRTGRDPVGFCDAACKGG